MSGCLSVCMYVGLSVSLSAHVSAEKSARRYVSAGAVVVVVGRVSVCHIGLFSDACLSPCVSMLFYVCVSLSV